MFDLNNQYSNSIDLIDQTRSIIYDEYEHNLIYMFITLARTYETEYMNKLARKLEQSYITMKNIYKNFDYRNFFEECYCEESYSDNTIINMDHKFYEETYLHFYINYKPKILCDQHKEHIKYTKCKNHIVHTINEIFYLTK